MMYALQNKIAVYRTWFVLVGLCTLLFLPFSIDVTPQHATDIITVQTALAQEPEDETAWDATKRYAGDATSFVTGKLYNATVRPIVNLIGNIILTLAASVLWIAGTLFEASLTYTVVEMGERFGDGLGGAVNDAWTLVRDICNLAFIFGFIYLGFQSIFDPHSAETKKNLSHIIIGALLINFSLYFTQAIVDISNFFSVQIYNAIVANGGSLTEIITNQLGVVTLYDTPGIDEMVNLLTSDTTFWFYILGAIFLLITAFVFFSAAFLLISRFVGLILIMIGSPILFAGTIFHQTEHFASELWKKLMNYAFVVPVYLIAIYISIRMIGALGLQLDTFSTALLGETSDASPVVLKFTIIIFFMWASISIAEKAGIAGGSTAVSVANTLRGAAQSKLGRFAIGGTSAWALKKYEKFDTNPKWNDNSWRGKLKRTSEMVIDNRDITGALHAGEHATFGGAKSYESEHKYRDEESEKHKVIETFSKNVKEALDNPADTEKQITMERAVANASTKELENLLAEQRLAIAGYLSQEQIDNLKKSEKIDGNEQKKISDARKETIKQIYEAEREKLSKAGIDRLTSLGYEYLKQEGNAIHLTSSQMDDLKKKLTQTEFSNLSTIRENALQVIANGTRPVQTLDSRGAVIPAQEINSIDFILKKKPGEIAKMPSAVLTAQGLASQLPISTLSKIVTEGTLKKTDEATIRGHIEDAISHIHGPVTPAEQERLDDYEKWLTRTPLGRQFGK